VITSRYPIENSGPIDASSALPTFRLPTERTSSSCDVNAMLATVDQYTGADPMSLLFTEAYLAATRDEQLREQLGGVAAGFRERFGHWLAQHAVPASEETAAVLIAAVDGLILHRGLGSGPDTSTITAVLRRLLSQEEHT
jgi:hypothetical protein